MAKQVITSAVDAYWVDSEAKLNSNFDELYAKPGSATTALTSELNTLDGVAATLTTTATPASGSCGVQFYFTDAAGMATEGVRSGIGYISDINGAPATAITSVATLTNGTIVTLVTGRVFLWTTSADLELGITLTGTAATRYVTFVLPNGKIAVSTACIINA